MSNINNEDIPNSAKWIMSTPSVQLATNTDNKQYGSTEKITSNKMYTDYDKRMQNILSLKETKNTDYMVSGGGANLVVPLYTKKSDKINMYQCGGYMKLEHAYGIDADKCDNRE